jgi:TonB family protein
MAADDKRPEEKKAGASKPTPARKATAKKAGAKKVPAQPGSAGKVTAPGGGAAKTSPGRPAGPTAAARPAGRQPTSARVSSSAELRKLQSSYFYGLDHENKPLKVAFLISICFHLLLFWFMFPSIKKTEAKAVQQKRYVIQKFRLPPPPKKEILQKKTIKKTKEKKVFIPDPTPDEPEPIRDLEVAVVDDIPIEDDFIIAAPEEPPGPLVVGGDVKAPVEIFRVEPQYTEIAKAVRKEGIVIVQAVIDRNGEVRDVKVLKGLGFGLDESATDAVKKWKFKPGTLNGKPVDVIFTLTVRFQITT